MVQKELRRIVHIDLLDWNHKRYLKGCLYSWKKHFDESKKKKFKAHQHLKGKILLSWKFWTEKQGISGCDYIRYSCSMLKIQAFKEKWLRD